MGFGMKLAKTPCLLATSLTTLRYVMTLSAMGSTSS